MGWRETLEALYKNRDWKVATLPEREKAVADVIQVSSLAAAAVSATPVPLADVVLALPLQGAMVVAIGHIKGRDISKEQSLTIARELSTVVGTHMLAQRAFVALSRLVFPGMAGLLMAPWTFAVTYAMGRVSEMYFDDPNAPADAFKKRFAQGLDDARKAFSKDALLEFIKRQGREVEDFAKREAPPAPPSNGNAGPGSAGASAPKAQPGSPSGTSTPPGGPSKGPQTNPPPRAPEAPRVVEADWDTPDDDR